MNEQKGNAVDQTSDTSDQSLPTAGLAGAAASSETSVAAFVESVGLVADMLDNLLHAVMMPLPPALHVECLTGNIAKAHADLRAALAALNASHTGRE